MTPTISGTTGVIAHIGVPTTNFRAPLIYNPYFAATGTDVVVVPMGCEAEDLPHLLPPLLRLRNIVGALITMPHKVSVVPLLQETSRTVDICGACNAVKRGADGQLVGDMFDGEGFVRSARRKGQRLAGASALIVGAGGVGSAIAAALAHAGVASLTLFDQNAAAADRLAQRLRAAFPALAIETGRRESAALDIAVNATPLGMTPGDPFPFEIAQLSPATFVGDVVMTAQETPLLAAARAHGCATQNGTDMLFEMIPAYLEFFGLPTTTPDVLRRHALSPSPRP